MINNLVYIYITSQIYFTVAVSCVVNGLVFQNEDINHLQFAKHKQWMKVITTVSVRYCHEEITDSLIKGLMSNTISVMINDKVVHSHNENLKIDFLVLTNSDNEYTDKCLNSKIPQSKLVSKTILVIYDTSHSPANDQIEEGYWQYIGAADVLYLKGNQCWQAAPSYMFNRSFSKAQGCFPRFFNNQDSTPNMQGQTIEAVTFHRPLSTIINFNETLPSSK